MFVDARLISINNGAQIGGYDVGNNNAYLANITPNTSYRLTAEVNDAGGRYPLTNNDVITWNTDPASGNLSDFVVNSDGTFTFTFTSGSMGAPESPSKQDRYIISVNGFRALTFWTNTY